MKTLKNLIDKFFRAMSAATFAEHGDHKQAIEIMNSCEEEKCLRNTQK